MKILISADHRGADAAHKIGERLERDELGSVEYVDMCADTPCDYPERAYAVALRVAGGEADRGVLICGTGIGMSLAANKVPGIRAAVVHDELTAELSRSHNDANILCLSADLLGMRIMEKIVDVWFRTDFEGGRHARRVRKIHAIEQGMDPATVTDDPATFPAQASAAGRLAPQPQSDGQAVQPAPHARIEVSLDTRAKTPSHSEAHAKPDTHR